MASRISEPRYPFIDREIVVLAMLVAVTVVVFFATRRFAAANDQIRRQDAESWYVIGNGSLQTGNLNTAVPARRRAAAKDPDSALYRRTLATALMASHDDDAARQLLLQLRDQQADDAETDLQLAHYQSAIVALWQAAQRPARQQVLTEFVQFLLRQGRRDRALSELLVLEAGLSDGLSSQLSAGTMLLAAGDARRALAHFEKALITADDVTRALGRRRAR